MKEIPADWFPGSVAVLDWRNSAAVAGEESPIAERAAMKYHMGEQPRQEMPDCAPGQGRDARTFEANLDEPYLE